MKREIKQLLKNRFNFSIVEPFDIDYFIITSDEEKAKFNKMVFKNIKILNCIPTDSVANTTSITFNGKVKFIVVSVLADKEKYSTAQIAALCAHEAYHVFQKACEDVGELNPSSEFSAYSIQQITQTILDRLGY